MNPRLLQIKSCLTENEAVIERVLIHFVFNGDPAEAERSPVLDKLREDLENKKHLIDQRFGRPVTLVVESRSGRSRRVTGGSVRKTRTYPIHFQEPLAQTGPDGEILTVGFLRLMDFHRIYDDMGQRLFDRNIRATLSGEEAVNRSLDQSFKRIVLDGSEPASVFAFNHNGVTLSAEALRPQDGVYRITEPRLLNGAQTVATLSRFIKLNAKNQKLADANDSLDGVYVLAKFVTNATPCFVTTVTINNNRQNPVEPSNLRATMTSSSSYRRNSLKSSEFTTRVKRIHSRISATKTSRILALQNTKRLNSSVWLKRSSSATARSTNFFVFERCLKTTGSTAKCSPRPG